MSTGGYQPPDANPAYAYEPGTPAYTILEGLSVPRLLQYVQSGLLQIRGVVTLEEQAFALTPAGRVLAVFFDTTAAFGRLVQLARLSTAYDAAGLPRPANAIVVDFSSLGTDGAQSTATASSPAVTRTVVGHDGGDDEPTPGLGGYLTSLAALGFIPQEMADGKS